MAGSRQYETQFAAGTLVAPVAGSMLVELQVSRAGFYEVQTWAGFGATGDVGTNVALRVDGINRGGIPMTSGAGTTPTQTTLRRLYVAQGGKVELVTIGAAALGAVYNAWLVVTQIAD